MGTVFNKNGGEGGLNVQNAVLKTSSTKIKSGHVAVVGVGQLAQGGTSNANITISGTRGTDYEVILTGNSTNVINGQLADSRAQRFMVIKAINDVNVTVSHGNSGGNFPSWYSMVADLS
jgi:hypothetical protein